MTTIAALTDYVVTNRRGKAFIDWSPIEIAESMVQAANEGLLIYAETNDEIHGVAVGMRIGKIVFCTNILTTKPGVLHQLFRRFRQLYPTIEIEAERRGKLFKYNTTKLAQKLKA